MEGRAKTLHQILLINGFSKVTDDSIIQGAAADAVVGVRRHQDRRNRVPRLNEVSMQLNPAHCWHLHVGDQADRFNETRGCEKIGRRREDLDSNLATS